MNIVELGKWIAKERKEQGLIQDDLAGMIGQSYSLISDLERARRRGIGFDMLRRVVAALGYELSFTVTKIERKP